MKIQIFDIEGKQIEDLILNDKIWNIIPHKQAMYSAVIAQQSSWRQGTHKTKTRAEVSGGGRKPWKQKGTGRARQGSIRAPQWKGGGVVFGPTLQKKYVKYVNKKVKKLAIKSALSLKIKEKAIIIIDEFKILKFSTKKIIIILNNLKIYNQKILIITFEGDEIVSKSARNIKKVNIIPINGINIYDILNANILLTTKKIIKMIEEKYI